MKKLNYNLIAHGLLIAILATLIIVASFYDMAISDALNSHNAFTSIGSILGKTPAYLIAAFAGIILYKSARERDKTYSGRTLLMILYALVVIGASMMFGYAVADGAITSTKETIIVAVLLGLITALLFFITTKTISIDTVNRLKKWAFTALIAIAAIIIITSLVKIAWGRARYEDITDGAGAFTAWYVPNGYTGHKSMPSGHVALASTIFMLVPMFKALPGLHNIGNGVSVLSVVFVTIIALARIMGGHHFLSDVTISIIIGYAVMYVCSILAFGKHYDNFTFKQTNILSKL